MLTKVDIVLETMSSRSSSRVFSLSTVPSRSSTWPTKSHGPAAMNAGRDRASSVFGPEHVAGDLLADEPAERKVGVEGGDDIVAIGPGMVAALVLVVAVRVAVMHDVKPVPAPALAIMGTGEQPIDERLVGVGIGVVRRTPRFRRESAAGRSSRTRGGGSGCGDRPRGWASSPCCSSVARMNESIGVRAQVDPGTVGTCGRTSGSKAHQR